MTVTFANLDVDRQENEQVTSFVPSRDLPILAKRSGGTASLTDIASSLHRIASSLGVAKGQSEHIFVDVRQPDQKAKDAYPIFENIQEFADQFETQFTHRWLLNVNRIDWSESSFDEELIEDILSESSRLVAVLSGQSASGGIRKVYHFPQSFTTRSHDPISITIREAAIVEDSLGGRTWSAAPLLADFLLSQINNDPINQLNILELGAGTGLTGLTMAKALQNIGKKVNVHLTDYNENVLNNLMVNARLNKAERSSVKVKVFPLDWSEAQSNLMLETNNDLRNTYDCLLCADCVYEPQHAELIHAVASRLLTKKRSISSRPSLSGKMFVLTPQRANLQNETEALYRFFPQSDIISQHKEKGELHLCITSQQHYILESQEDFGPPKLRTLISSADTGPSSFLRAHLIDAANNSHIDGTIYRLHTIEWCNVID